MFCGMAKGILSKQLVMKDVDECCLGLCLDLRDRHQSQEATPKAVRAAATTKDVTTVTPNKLLPPIRQIQGMKI